MGGAFFGGEVLEFYVLTSLYVFHGVDVDAKGQLAESVLSRKLSKVGAGAGTQAMCTHQSTTNLISHNNENGSQT